jgi:hypothetical protein
MTTNPLLSVRMPADEIAAVDRIAAQRGCSRSDAARLAIRFGAPMVEHGFKIDLTRLLFILEHLGASIDVIMARDHADVYEHLTPLANKRMEQFHA